MALGRLSIDPALPRHGIIGIRARVFATVTGSAFVVRLPSNFTGR